MIWFFPEGKGVMHKSIRRTWILGSGPTDCPKKERSRKQTINLAEFGFGPRAKELAPGAVMDGVFGRTLQLRELVEDDDDDVLLPSSFAKVERLTRRLITAWMDIKEKGVTTQPLVGMFSG